MRRDVSAQTLLSTVLMVLIIALVGLKLLTRCAAPAGAEAPAGAVQLTGNGALLTWVTTHEADSVTITRCRAQACAFVDIVATAPARPHTLLDQAAKPGDTYTLHFYRVRSGALDWVADDGPYAVPFASWLPLIGTPHE